MISGPLPPWGSDTWGRGVSNWPTWRQTRRPLRPVPPTAKTPLFFHSERGSPFQMEELGGGPQEMAFVRAAAGWYRAKTWGRPRFRARWTSPGLVGPTPTEGFSHGDSGQCPDWAAKILALAQTAPPCPDEANCTERLQLSKVWAKLRKKGL